MKKYPWFSGVLRGRRKTKRVEKDTEIGETNDEKQDLKKSILEVLKEPYFYLMVFLWFFALCLGVYAILIGAIVPY